MSRARRVFSPIFSFWRMVFRLLWAGEVGGPTILRGEVKPSYSFREEW